MKAKPTTREMASACERRDASYDGVFFLAVRTTGIFCRPSCPARKPRPENVEYYPRVEDAMAAGYRACKRCHPLEATGAVPAWIQPLFAHIESAATERITDDTIRDLGIDPARARRWFRSRYGLTVHAWCRQQRMGTALAAVRDGAGLDDVVFETGYESHSGFRDAFANTFGGPPGRARDTALIVTDRVETPLGPMVLAAGTRALCLAEFASRRALKTQIAIAERRFGTRLVPGRNAIIEQAERELREYFAGHRRDFSVPMEAPGTEFQTRVWEALRAIPYGETRAYEDIARAIGNPDAVRAVGTANGMNRLAILIPCHRVVRKSGEMGGYGGGKWRKLALLDLEGATLAGIAQRSMFEKER